LEIRHTFSEKAPERHKNDGITYPRCFQINDGFLLANPTESLIAKTVHECVAYLFYNTNLILAYYTMLILKYKRDHLFSGLRGAIAFALALHLPFDETTKKVIVSTTLVIVLFTIVFMGGSTNPMIKVCLFHITRSFSSLISLIHTSFTLPNFCDNLYRGIVFYLFIKKFALH
jgi:hypothetical protein